ncbi:DNA-3-methyladenine glycosylase 2 family protein [Brevifollis gellanilyticus]|uniref:DNA-3-methyladenine glycosylase II n=1 Tax=Brevifollis gellanilyticus TaxID=748831 RepID=A0A512MGM1_9BACT|nr:DNA-3-methyladenine glycosylase 2 [Brevifollis gellanilyticus]GEP45883.1 DNA methylase [Brevifollis gellanilyticus]
MILDAEACYAAHRGRDARFDGVFFTGVKTTGIYCRPVCPARTPAATSCDFFDTASAAEAAGFRPCLRCRPEVAPGSPGTTLADSLLRRVRERAMKGMTLETMEPEMGLSMRQVRRIFLTEFGVTPVQVVQTQRLLMAKQWLRETTRPISEIALAAGFRSLRNFNAVFREHYRMAPSACRTQQTRTDDVITLRLAYREPLAWETMMNYFRSRLLPGVEEIKDGEYHRTVMLGKAMGWIRVSPMPKEAALRVEVSPGLMPVLGTVQSRVRRMFDLDARPDLIEERLGDDELLAPVMKKHPGLRVCGAWEVFELAVRAVLGQQITVRAATTLSARLVNEVGHKVETPFENLNQLGITPEAIAKMSIDALCRLGLVSARAKTLHHLAEFAMSGGFDFPPGQDHEAVVAKLVALPGIGPWTAHYIAMRALRYPDAFPAADLGLRKAIGKGELVSTRAATERSEAWRPWRAYASIALWTSLTP